MEILDNMADQIIREEFESCVRSLRDCGPEYIGAEECRLLDRLDALRSIQAEGGT